MYSFSHRLQCNCACLDIHLVRQKKKKLAKNSLFQPHPVCNRNIRTRKMFIRIRFQFCQIYYVYITVISMAQWFVYTYRSLGHIPVKDNFLYEKKVKLYLQHFFFSKTGFSFYDFKSFLVRCLFDLDGRKSKKMK